MWFTSRGEATSTGTGFYIISWESKHSSAATYYAAWDILGNSAHTVGSPSLLDLFSLLILPSYNILFLSPSLSQSLRIVTYMLLEPATGYSKITTDWITEPELDSFSMSYNTKWLWANRLTDSLTSYLIVWIATQLYNLLQYKIHAYIGRPKVSPYYNTVGLSQQ